jgi:hypothetical protein
VQQRQGVIGDDEGHGGSSQYQPPVARMIAPVAATPAAAAAPAESGDLAGHGDDGYRG